ncbi:DUF4129 domain-containing protein [Subtercola sp. YIM 133946]|uniref:DUF4129 domain-containing protein n=1 Tax=Subtercola sp. YIM 133946 TaxID=3118909 RepID=UPI002F939CA9
MTAVLAWVAAGGAAVAAAGAAAASGAAAGGAVLGATGAAVPVDPSAPDARQLLLDELSRPEYAAARPTLLDRVASAVGDWLASLTVPSDGNLGGLVPALGVVVALALIVAAFIVFGRPRRNRQAPTRVDALFGSDDRRSSAQLRASAAVAAEAGDYLTAIEEIYRSIARRQAERTVVRVSPGTTAREFALRAGASYPEQSGRLGDAAGVFDDVRYLGGRATAERYGRLASLEAELRDLLPTRREPLVGAGMSGGAGVASFHRGGGSAAGSSDRNVTPSGGGSTAGGSTAGGGSAAGGTGPDGGAADGTASDGGAAGHTASDGGAPDGGTGGVRGAGR